MKRSEELETLIEQLVQQQQELLLTMGRQIIPTLTSEDLLQPNDYPELEYHPGFRYEEGILAGMLSVAAAIRASS